MSMTENEAIYDLKFIKKAYENLVENGADSYRAVGKGVDCSVRVETNEDLYKHYVETMEMAIEALEKQIPKKPLHDYCWHCPNCEEEVYWDTECGQQKFRYCHNCGQKIDWN